MNESRRFIVKAGALLAGSALVGTGLLFATHRHAAPFLAQNQRQRLLASLSVVLEGISYDNALLDDFVDIADPALLGMDTPTRVYRARERDQLRAVAFEIVAPKGYAGPIRLVVGISVEAAVTGVRVLSHRETPGLGDTIEARKSDWIDEFRGKTRHDPGADQWAVRKDGGSFEQLTGATITPRAVVAAVYNALLFFNKHYQMINAHEADE